MGPGMELREVRVSFRKTLSDGNYGNETVEAGATAEPEVGMSLEAACGVLADGVRAVVLAQLARSKSQTIRDGLLSAEEQEARWRAERRARREAADSSEAG